MKLSVVCKIYIENLRKTNLKMARFYWLRSSRDSSPTSSATGVTTKGSTGQAWKPQAQGTLVPPVKQIALNVFESNQNYLS